MLVPAQPGAISTLGQVFAFQGFTVHTKVESYILREVKLRLMSSTNTNIWLKPGSDGYSRAKYWRG